MYEVGRKKNVVVIAALLSIAILLMGCNGSHQGGKDDPVVFPQMVNVPGGMFMMGDNNGEINEKPEHEVTVSGFLMGKYQISQKEWQSVMGSNPSYLKGDSLPVERVSWPEAVEYSNKLSEKAGLTKVYTVSGETTTMNMTANGYRLPTEAEWEYAARGNADPRQTYAGSDTAGDVAWHKENSEKRTHPVGLKAGNGFGLYDMSGNVFELCWDWYGSYGSEGQKNPTGPDSGSERVERGGSWALEASSSRSARRYFNSSSHHSYDMGLRLVRSIR